jgi:hypothetical protein
MGLMFYSRARIRMTATKELSFTGVFDRKEFIPGRFWRIILFGPPGGPSGARRYRNLSGDVGAGSFSRYGRRYRIDEGEETMFLKLAK